MQGKIRTIDIRQPFTVVVDKKTGKSKSVRTSLSVNRKASKKVKKS